MQRSFKLPPHPIRVCVEGGRAITAKSLKYVRMSRYCDSGVVLSAVRAESQSDITRTDVEWMRVVCTKPWFTGILEA